MIALLALLLAAPAGALSEHDVPEAKPISVHATIDHEQITLGQPFELIVEVVHDAADTYALPPDLAKTLEGGSLKLRSEPMVSRAQAPQGAKTTLVVPLADVASMKPKIPAFALDVQ